MLVKNISSITNNSFSAIVESWYFTLANARLFNSSKGETWLWKCYGKNTPNFVVHIVTSHQAETIVSGTQ